jgi:hypothetical protein
MVQHEQYGAVSRNALDSLDLDSFEKDSESQAQYAANDRSNQSFASVRLKDRSK